MVFATKLYCADRTKLRRSSRENWGAKSPLQGENMPRGRSMTPLPRSRRPQISTEKRLTTNLIFQMHLARGLLIFDSFPDKCRPIQHLSITRSKEATDDPFAQ